MIRLTPVSDGAVILHNVHTTTDTAGQRRDTSFCTERRYLTTSPVGRDERVLRETEIES